MALSFPIDLDDTKLSLNAKKRQIAYSFHTDTFLLIYNVQIIIITTKKQRNESSVSSYAIEGSTCLAHTKIKLLVRFWNIFTQRKGWNQEYKVDKGVKCNGIEVTPVYDKLCKRN